MVAMIPAAEMAHTKNTAFSKWVRRMLFGLSLHSWEQLMLVALGGAALAAVFIVVTSTAVVVLTRAAADQTKREFDVYRLTVEGQVADARKEGIEAGKTAGNALVRAAELEKEAANARLQTEQIKAVVAWRTIPPVAASELERILVERPGSVNLRYMDGDPEALFLAIQISQILGKANWQIAPGAVKPANAIVFGIVLPDATGADAQKLREAFSRAQVPFSSDPMPSEGAAFNISTIDGAPTLMIGSRTPPQLP
jgi:hypothetical protein